MPLLHYDAQYASEVSGLMGVDEAGRGALAGPVVAAAMWLSPEFYQQAAFHADVQRIRDSKLLSAKEREALLALFLEWQSKRLLCFSWAEASVKEIEVCNILGATRLAMHRALDALAEKLPAGLSLSSSSLFENTSSKHTPLLLIDGLPLRSFEYDHRGVIKGDQLSLAIAMASIVAKVNRDALMTSLAQSYPGYALETHKGYGTALHRELLLEKGPSACHRKSFLKKILNTSEE